MTTNVSGGILTVAALRQILATVDDSAQIVIAGDDIGLAYQNVRAVATPDGHTFCAVTLFVADTYDPRQH